MNKNRIKLIKNAELLLSDLGFIDCSNSDAKNYKLNINTYSDDFINIVFGGGIDGYDDGKFLFEIIAIKNDAYCDGVIKMMYFDTIEEVISIIFSNFDCFNRFEKKYNIKIK